MIRPFSPFVSRRLILCLLGLLTAVMVAVLLFPIRFGSLRLTLVCGWFLLWASGLWLCWKQRPVRLAAGVLAAVAGFFLLGPGRPIDGAAVRRGYATALRSYQGAPYLWGGECRRGIDCSGLVRRGMIDAVLRQGVTTLNPAAVRAAFELWFFDSSAEAMGNEYRGRSRLLFRAPSLNTLDVRRLQPGDFAVTRTGIHTLAYLGGGEWIQADPGAGQVVTERAPSKNAWFAQSMKIMRWRMLEE